MMKHSETIAVLFVLGSILGGHAWGEEMGSPKLTGTSRALLETGTSAIIPGLSVNGHAGKGLQGVNLYTGQPSYSIPLGGVSALSFGLPITLNYTGATKPIVQNDNERAPASWVGLGFNLTMPYVAVNHKGTYTRSDDILYCDLGPYGGGQLVSDDGVSFSLATNPYIKIYTDTFPSNTEQAGQFMKWIFRFPDGKGMAFGEDTNSQRYVLYHEGVIQAPAYATSGSYKFTYRWDVSSFWDSPPPLSNGRANFLTFEYERFLTPSTPGKSYVSEAYVQNIRWKAGDQDVERYEFKTVPKGNHEYVGYASGEPRHDQKLFETRVLDSLKCYKEGSLAYGYKFDWDMSNPKRLLTGIRIFHPNPVLPGSLKRDSGWTFKYDSKRFLLLSSVVTPSSRKDSLIYGERTFGLTDGAQDVRNYAMLRQDNVTEVPLPPGATDRAAWSIENSCDERFCYSVVRDGDSQSLPEDTYQGTPFSKKVYVEVKRNTGNYFDPRATDEGETSTLRLELGHPANGEKDWKISSMGDYLLVVGEKTGTVNVWEYDGIKWVVKSPFLGDPRWSGGFNSPIKVYPSANYFVVQKMQSPSVLIVALRAPDGWTSLNRSTCQFSNKASYGEPIRASQTSGECLEWSSNDLIITPARNFFSVLDPYTDAFCVYALAKAGDGFTEISTRITSVSSPSNLQRSGYPMNWDQNVASVVSNGEDLFIQSMGASPWLHGFHFDGHYLVETMSQSFPGSGPVVAFPSKDYLLVAQPRSASGTIDYFPRRARTNGIPYFESADKKIVRNDWNSAWRIQVRTHPKAFSVEYYPDSASVGLRPKWEASPSTNYRSYLYHVSRSYTDGFSDRSSQLGRFGINFYNISFSGSDDILNATSGTTNSTLSRCNENPNVFPCDIYMYSARFHPENTTTFISDEGKDRVYLSYNNAWKSQKQSQDVISNCARLMMRATLDTVGSSGRVRSRMYQFDGKGYYFPDSQFVVTDVISSAALTEGDKDRVWTHIDYAPKGSGTTVAGIAEFNSHLQVPQFEFADVSQINSNGVNANMGFTRTYFNLDSYANNLTGKRISMRGTQKGSRIFSTLGDTLSYHQSAIEPYRKASWPSPLFINRTRSVISREVSKNKGFIADTTYYLGYCDTNGAPRFTLRNSRPEKIRLTQNVYDALGLPIKSMAYNLSSQPDTAALRTWPNATLYGTNPVSASKTVYDGYYFLRDSVWNETDQTLTDTDLRSGKSPFFNWAEGWLPAREVTQRDIYSFQVLEMKVRKNAASGAQGESYTATFYEGLRFNPVAVVSNAKRSDCAVLMAENGNAGFTGARLDYPSQWENSGGSFSSERSHTGRYSIKVVDGFGPVLNLHLKDVRALGYDFKVSAWIYSPSITPVVSLERYQSNGVFLDGVAGLPVSGSMSAGKWQRWEARLSYAQLTAGNRFNGGNEYVRMTFGTGSPTGNASRIVYVDDIVCIPSTAEFSLSTYDKSGTPTSVTGGNFLPTYYDLGFRGNVMAVRDENYRIFSQNAVHKMGEN